MKKRKTLSWQYNQNRFNKTSTIFIPAHIKDAMQTSCSKCTEKQKKGARKVVRHIRAKEQDYWKQILAKYDPEDQYKENYESFLAAEDWEVNL